MMVLIKQVPSCILIGTRYLRGGIDTATQTLVVLSSLSLWRVSVCVGDTVHFRVSNLTALDN
jgi:hypothetical protein